MLHTLVPLLVCHTHGQDCRAGLVYCAVTQTATCQTVCGRHDPTLASLLPAITTRLSCGEHCRVLGYAPVFSRCPLLSVPALVIAACGLTRGHAIALHQMGWELTSSVVPLFVGSQSVHDILAPWLVCSECHDGGRPIHYCPLQGHVLCAAHVNPRCPRHPADGLLVNPFAALALPHFAYPGQKLGTDSLTLPLTDTCAVTLTPTPQGQLHVVAITAANLEFQLIFLAPDGTSMHHFWHLCADGQVLPLSYNYCPDDCLILLGRVAPHVYPPDISKPGTTHMCRQYQHNLLVRVPIYAAVHFQPAGPERVPVIAALRGGPMYYTFYIRLTVNPHYSGIDAISDTDSEDGPRLDYQDYDDISPYRWDGTCDCACCGKVFASLAALTASECGFVLQEAGQMLAYLEGLASPLQELVTL